GKKPVAGLARSLAKPAGCPSASWAGAAGVRPTRDCPRCRPPAPPRRADVYPVLARRMEADHGAPARHRSERAVLADVGERLQVACGGNASGPGVLEQCGAELGRADRRLAGPAGPTRAWPLE